MFVRVSEKLHLWAFHPSARPGPAASNGMPGLNEMRVPVAETGIVPSEGPAKRNRPRSRHDGLRPKLAEDSGWVKTRSPGSDGDHPRTGHTEADVGCIVRHAPSRRRPRCCCHRGRERRPHSIRDDRRVDPGRRCPCRRPSARPRGTRRRRTGPWCGRRYA